MHVSLDMFFDAPRIMRAMDEKTRRVLGSAGAYARVVMQRGMRKRKGAGAPGQYPAARSSNPLLRNMIRFGFDTGSKSLVVGPALLDRTDREVAATGKTVPELINYGGVVPRHKVWDPQKKQIRYLRRGQRPRPWRYRARPFVGLTLPKAAAILAKKMDTLKFKK